MGKSKSKFSIISYVDDPDSTSTEANSTKDQSKEISDAFINVTTTSKNHHNQLSTTQTKTIENAIIIWLNLNIDNSDKDKDNLILQLRDIISTIKAFTDINECVDFLTDVTDEKVFMIISDYSNQNFLSLVNEIPQLHSIYIFNNSSEKHQQYMKECEIIKGIYTQIEHISYAIKQDVHRLVMDLTPFSIIPSNSSLNLDALDQSFMYTKLLKEIIIDIDYDPKKSRKEFTQFCHDCSATNDFQMEKVNQFQQNYENHSAIWWYTKEWFVYSLLNKALRTQDIETIIKMGFFVQDLHREIQKRHSEKHNTTNITIYRGQGLLKNDFEKLKQSEGGLFSFNNFLSTSTDREISLMFADSARENPDLIGILFEIKINPSLSSTPFTSIDDISSFECEAEILFSMHTIFRIGKMNKIDDGLWEVSLALTDDNDQQLKCLTDYIRSEIGDENGWIKMALLMLKMGRYDKVREIWNMLPSLLSEGDPDALETIQTCMGDNSGAVEYSLGNYLTALSSYKKFLKMVQEIWPHEHTVIANLYNSIGLTYQSMGDFSSAHLNYEKALESEEKSLSSNSITLARIYNNIALTHQSAGSFSNALSYFEKALEILHKYLPPGHPDVATNYNNIAEVYMLVCNYPLALSYAEKALETQQKYLPSDHPDLAMGHNNIGVFHQSIGNYTLAVSHHEKALEIQRNSLPSNHPHLISSHNNIGAIYFSMGNFSSALSNLEEALEICQKSLPSNHPHLAMTHSHISQTHQAMNNYSLALLSLEKTLEIQQESLPSEHPDLAKTYNNMGEAYRSMGDYSTAFFYYEIALEMWRKLLPSNHANFAMIYNNIGATHQSLGNYSAALSFYQMTLEIQQNILPPEHPDLVRTYSNIACVSQLNQDIISYASNMENALKLQQKSILANHSLLGISSSNVNEVKEIMENYTTAVSGLKKFGQLYQKLVPSGGLDIDINDENIDKAEEFIGTCSTMISNFEKALQLQKKSQLCNHPVFIGTQINSNDHDQTLDHYLTMFSSLKRSFTIPSADDQQTSNNDENPLLTNDFSTALTACQQVLQIQQKYNAPNDVSLSTNYNSIGQVYYLLGDYINALSLFQKALENLQTCIPINQQLLAKTYNNISMALDGLSRYREAVDYAKQAANIAHSTLGPDHLETKAYQNYFDQLKRKL